jgi:hypothetical protein
MCSYVRKNAETPIIPGYTADAKFDGSGLMVHMKKEFLTTGMVGLKRCCVKNLRRNEIMLVRLLELSWWLYIHEKKQLHEVIYMTSETPNRHMLRIFKEATHSRREKKLHF